MGFLFGELENDHASAESGSISMDFSVKGLLLSPSLVLLAGRCQSAKWQAALGYAWLANGTREKGGGRWVKRLFGYVGLDLN